jgi:hypothetical protein
MLNHAATAKRLAIKKLNRRSGVFRFSRFLNDGLPAPRKQSFILLYLKELQ